MARTARLRALLAGEVLVLALASVGLYSAFGEAKADQPAASVSTGTHVDHFDVAGALGRIPGGPAWQAGRAWAVGRGMLAHDGASPSDDAALVPGARDAAVQAIIAAAGRGWGLTVRWAGPRDHWLVEIVPRDSSYRLIRVAGGRRTQLGVAAGAPIAKGTEVRLIASGRRVVVVVAGRARITAIDPDPIAGRVGVVAVADGVELLAWDDVTVGGPLNVVFPPPAGP